MTCILFYFIPCISILKVANFFWVLEQLDSFIVSYYSTFLIHETLRLRFKIFISRNHIFQAYLLWREVIVASLCDRSRMAIYIFVFKTISTSSGMTPPTTSIVIKVTYNRIMQFVLKFFARNSNRSLYHFMIKFSINRLSICTSIFLSVISN